MKKFVVIPHDKYQRLLELSKNHSSTDIESKTDTSTSNVANQIEKQITDNSLSIPVDENINTSNLTSSRSTVIPPPGEPDVSFLTYT